MTNEDWDKISKTMYPQMNHRPDHDKIVERICKCEIVATKIEINGPGSCSVYVQLPDGWWGEWVDVWISDNDVNTEWNNIYMDDIKRDTDVYVAATVIATEYAEAMGVIIQDENGEWKSGNI